VTGENYPERERARALVTHTRNVAAAAMPMHLPASKIKMRMLVFVALKSFEGELRVGLGRVSKRVGDTKLEIAWCERTGWSNDRSKSGFYWKPSPSFVAHMPGRRVLITNSPVCDILPVPVTLTEKSEHDPLRSLADKKQKIRVEKPCVQLLRVYLEKHRPELAQQQSEELESDDCLFATIDPRLTPESGVLCVKTNLVLHFIYAGLAPQVFCACLY
jgi:hypothetical protein